MVEVWRRVLETELPGCARGRGRLQTHQCHSTGVIDSCEFLHDGPVLGAFVGGKRRDAEADAQAGEGSERGLSAKQEPLRSVRYLTN